MKKVITFLILFILLYSSVNASFYQGAFGPMTDFDKKIVTLGTFRCESGSYDESDIPTIFIPGIMGSWYSAEGRDEKQIKRWIPDPIKHTYDPLFFAFKNVGYDIKDVFYDDEFNIHVVGNPKHSLYLFGYDWKKDNKITATLLTQLIAKIYNEYETYNGCNIGKVNIISHSMGGIVARAMLEDMCVGIKIENTKMLVSDYQNDPNYPKNGKLQSFDSTPCTNYFPYPGRKTTSGIGSAIRVHKFVTVGTPQRGSPGGIPVWERGTLGQTEDSITTAALKSQLTDKGIPDFSDEILYERIHGYDTLIPNGIVTLGQLLPDIQKDTPYNKQLEYLYKIDEHGNNLITRKNYPVNSFLEELNTTSNIAKMWTKIQTHYKEYYASITNPTFSNVVGFETQPIQKDFTELTLGKGIYDQYSQTPEPKIYQIHNNVQNSTGRGGDGTVPTLNAQLVPNDSQDGQIISNPKFSREEINCDEKSYENIGFLDKEACKHQVLATATIPKILQFLGATQQSVSPNQTIIKNLGHTNYNEITPAILTYNDTEIGYTSINKGIDPNVFISRYFTKDKFIPTETRQIGDKKQYSLDFVGLSEKMGNILKYEVLSPINLLITDENGHRIGVDPQSGKIINEIPGAWTSGDTEGTGEPEIFMIPTTNTGTTKHHIQTYATGNGEYHIVTTKLNNTGAELKPNTIAGTAQLAFAEDYQVNITNSGTTTKNLTTTLPTTLDIPYTNYSTEENNIKINYAIRGNHTKVNKIQYTIGKDTVTKTLSGTLEIPLPNINTQTIDIQLLDANNKPLTNKESQKTITITRKTPSKSIEEQSKTNGYQTQTGMFTQKQAFLSDEIIKKYNKLFTPTSPILPSPVGEGLGVRLNPNPLNLIKSTLGYNLKHNYESRLYKDPQTKEIQAILPNGKINIYTLTKTTAQTQIIAGLKIEKQIGTYSQKYNQKLPLTQTMTGYIITDQETQTNYTYDNNTNKLINIDTPNDNISLTYTTGNSLLKTVSNGDSTLTFTYNDKQQLIKINDTLRKTIEIQYTPNSKIPIVEQVSDNNTTDKPNQNQEMNVSYTFESPYRKTLPVKYDAKIEILMKKLEKDYGKTKLERLKRKVTEMKEAFLNKIQNLYFYMDCRYILEKIEKS